MSTWYQDHKEELKLRPWMGRPSWELRHMQRALSMCSLLNTAEEHERLIEVTRELKIRRSKKS